MREDTKSAEDIHQSKTYNDTEIKRDCNNSKMSSISDNLKCSNASAEEIIQNPGIRKSFFQYRYIVALLGFSTFFQINFYRIATSISIVAMVNNSAISYESNSSTNVASCLSNSSAGEEFIDFQMTGEFNWSPDTQGYILSAGFLGYVITPIPGGMLSEIYGGKIIIVSGLFMSTIAHILSPLAAQHSSHLMILAQIIRGAGQGLLMAPYSIIASNWFPSVERGLFNSLILAGIAVGALISAFSAGTLCASSILGGWPSVYYIYGSIGLVQCFCVQQFLYESPKIHPKITEEEKSYILHYQEADLNKKRPPTPWKDITRSIPVYAMTYAMFGAYWAATHLLTIHPIFLTTMLHFSLEENGFLVSLTFVIQIILSFGTSFVSNWLNRHNLVGVDKLRKGINFLASLGYSLGLLGIYFAGCDATMSKWLGIIGMSFSGFVFGGCMIVPLDMSPTFAGTLMGLTTTAASSAAFILPLIYGKMIQEEQSLAQWNKIYFISIAVIMSGGIIFCLFGSAEIQPWNYTSEDQRRNNCSKDGKKKDKINETVTAIEAVVHL